MSEYSFGAGEFFLIEEVIAQCRTPGNFDGKSVRILGTVEHFDVIRNRVLVKHNGSTIQVDTSLIGPCPFHKGWLFQFIGEIDNSAVRTFQLVCFVRAKTTFCMYYFVPMTKILPFLFVTLGAVFPGKALPPCTHSNRQTTPRFYSVHSCHDAAKEIHVKNYPQRCYREQQIAFVFIY